MTKEVELVPVNDCVLVELLQSRQNVTVREGKYDTRTEGIVKAASKERLVAGGALFGSVWSATNLIGKKVYFEEYKEGTRIKREGKVYAFIKLEDIRGYEV